MFRDGDRINSRDGVEVADKPTALLATLDEMMAELNQPIAIQQLDQAVINLPSVIRKIKSQVVRNRDWLSAEQLTSISWSIWEMGILVRVADSKNIQDIHSGINECFREIKECVSIE
ncbi:MAG: hypothetical protein V1765_01365 [bacterium]